MSGDGGEEEQVSKVEASAPVSNTFTSTTSSSATVNTPSTTTTTATTTTVESVSPSSPLPNSVLTASAPVTPPPTTVSTATVTPAPSWLSPTAVVATPLDTPEEEEVEEEGSVGGEVSCTPERVYLSPEQLTTLSKEEFSEKWALQEKYLDYLQNRMETLEREVEELHGVRENEERLKGQLAELQRKEQYHIMRLSSKEHELQDMGAQIQELKNMSVGVGGLRNCLLDPAVNLLFERLKRDLDSARTKMEETQNELSAWKFTPDRCAPSRA